MQSNIFNPFHDPDWDRRVLEHPFSTVFHSSAWARVLAKTYGHTPLYLESSSGNGCRTVIPIMEVRSRLTGRRGVSLPFSDQCAPLIFGSDDADDTVLLHDLATLAASRGWKHIELRGGRFREWQPGLSFWTHRLELESDTARLWAGLSGSTRRGVRKAENAGLLARVSHSEEDLSAFLRLHARTRRRHGAPPQPLAFFRHLHREILDQGLGFVVVVEREKTVMAAAVFLRFGVSGIYKFGASDERYQLLRGNNLAMWRGIQGLVEAGCRSLEFGRTSTSNEGLRRFKLGWGADEARLDYYRYDLAHRAWVSWSDQASGIHRHLFGNLPLFLNRVAGRLIYPHLD